MEMLFGNRKLHLSGLYDGYDDVPGLTATVHLFSWEFPDGAGSARFRVELRQGGEPGEPPQGVGMVAVSAREVENWQGSTPLDQALLDGVLGHESVRRFFVESAREVLARPQPTEEELPFRKFKIRLKESG